MRHRTLFILIYLFAIHIAVAQVIPAERRTDWTLAGIDGAIPAYTRIENILDHGGSGDGTTSNDVAFQDALASVTGLNAVIFFPAGTYRFNASIRLRSGIVLRGEGAANTILRCSPGVNSNQHVIIAEGSLSSIIANITSSVLKDQSSIEVDNPSLFQQGDYIKIYQDDASLVNDSWALGSVAQMLHITNITGNIISFNNPLRRNYLFANAPKIKKVNMVTGAGIECLKLVRTDNSIASLPTSNIYLFCTANCWVKGVESDSCSFAHMQVGNSRNIDISNCYFHGAYDYGSGKGYGIACEYSSGECLIENNMFKHLRHSMLLQSGANGNVFSYNYSIEPHKSEAFPFDLAGDIVMHGNYPYLNLFEGNIVQNILIDASHGKNGPYNTVFRNRAESYGIIISSGAGDSSNIVGNEITSIAIGKGNYTIVNNGNFTYGNNKNGNILPAGTTTLPDNSYRYINTPFFWSNGLNWPSIGIPLAINTGTVPAKERFISGTGIAYCPATMPMTYIFTGNGNWDIPANWNDNTIPPDNLPAGAEIIIDPSGNCILNVPYTVSPGVILRVASGKEFIIEGDFDLQ